jgi:chromosomal replication initiation ATPase DnaA
MYLAHTRLHLPLTAAGALFGRDRTTAAHACKKVEDRREEVRLDLLLDCLERAIDVGPCQRDRQ